MKTRQKLRKGIILFTFFLFPVDTPALDLRLPDTAYQGDLIVGLVQPKALVNLKNHQLPVGPRGRFVVAVPRTQANDLLITAEHNGKKVVRTVRVWAYPWKTQHIEGLPERYVTPNPEQQRRIREDAQNVRSVRANPPHPVPLFLPKGFVKPVQGPVTSIFGSQRILNGIPRSPHSGIDIGASLGKTVHSPADGIVRLTAHDMYLMGNVLMLDHGLGVFSIFIHLDGIDVQVGDRVTQGDAIASVGKTGRATGPHLHWGVSVGQVGVDPLRLIRNRSHPWNR